MKKLIVVPTEREFDAFISSFPDARASRIGCLEVTTLPGVQATVAVGGLGKAQFAVHTQHLLDVRHDWDVVVCAGVAGALKPDLNIGDVVIATETVEHDFQKFNDNTRPRFAPTPEILAHFRALSNSEFRFGLHFAPIASGDQTILDSRHATALMESTGAIAVGWEGAGGARAAAFSGVPFLEVRAITDHADGDVPVNIGKNLPMCMRNIAQLFRAWTSSTS